MMATKGQTFERQDVPGLGQRQRRAVRREEAPGVRRQGRSRCPTPAGTSTIRDGFDAEKLQFVMELKNVRRGRIKEYAERFSTSDLHRAPMPSWTTTRCGRTPRTAAFPCATPERDQREGRQEPAWPGGVTVVSEGANMPTVRRGGRDVRRGGHPLRPGQGGQRRRRGGLGPGDGSEQHALLLARATKWTAAADDHAPTCTAACIEAAERFGTPGNYVNGANIAGFLKVADSMMDQGIV